MRDLAQYARALIGLRLTSTQLKAFQCYENELIAWNQRVNLTAIDKPNQIRTKHFLDSLTCLLAMRDSVAERVIDIGTGAGFPGLPLKIVCPTMQLTLVDSVAKKVAFCQHMVNLLGLERVEVLQERAENVGRMPAHRQQYDWAVARAVASMPVLMEYLLPLVKIGGCALAMKGESGPAEAHSAEHAIRVLGGKLRRIIHVVLPTVEEERYLILVDKVAATPERYPRRVGIPSKRPLQLVREST